MKKQAVLWMAVLLLATWIARGQTSYPMSLVVEQQAPAERAVVELSKISKITFAEGKMTLLVKDNAALPKNGVFALKEITKCLFSTQYAPTGLAAVLSTPSLITWRDTERPSTLRGLMPIASIV